MTPGLNDSCLINKKKIKSLPVTLLVPLTPWACEWWPLHHGTLVGGTSGPVSMILTKHAER